MKLLIVTSLKDFQVTVSLIFHKANISIFSTSEIAGFKPGIPTKAVDNWFSNGADSFDSIMLFSFTEAEKAEIAINMINDFNRVNPSEYPIRAFSLQVESATN